MPETIDDVEASAIKKPASYTKLSQDENGKVWQGVKLTTNCDPSYQKGALGLENQNGYSGAFLKRTVCKL